LSFEGKWASDHTNGECADFFSDLRHDGRCTRAGASAQTCGNEHHIAAFEYIIELFSRFFRGDFADIGVTTSTKPAGGFIANADTGGCAALEQHLSVSINGNKFYS
jgi:hypothetical protein